MVKGKRVSSYIGATVEALVASGYKPAAVIKHLKARFRGRAAEVDAAAKAMWIELINNREYVERVLGNLFLTCEKVIHANGGYV
jgi:hypothetical protein